MVWHRYQSKPGLPTHCCHPASQSLHQCSRPHHGNRRAGRSCGDGTTAGQMSRWRAHQVIISRTTRPMGQKPLLHHSGSEGEVAGASGHQSHHSANDGPAAAPAPLREGEVAGASGHQSHHSANDGPAAAPAPLRDLCEMVGAPGHQSHSANNEWARKDDDAGSSGRHITPCQEG